MNFDIPPSSDNVLVFCRMKETGNEVWFVGKYVGYRTEEISVDADYSEYDE